MADVSSAGRPKTSCCHSQALSFGVLCLSRGCRDNAGVLKLSIYSAHTRISPFPPLLSPRQRWPWWEWDHSGMRRKRKDTGWIWEGAGLEGGVDPASPALPRRWNGCQLLTEHVYLPSPRWQGWFGLPAHREPGGDVGGSTASRARVWMQGWR